jgi:hypothetical protein
MLQVRTWLLYVALRWSWAKRWYCRERTVVAARTIRSIFVATLRWRSQDSKKSFSPTDDIRQLSKKEHHWVSLLISSTINKIEEANANSKI